MNIETVNELIQSLESAGELSIKERKYLDLAKAYLQLAAENVGLKSAHPQPFGPEMMKALDAYEKHQDECPETGMLDAYFILRDSICITTPATDRIVAGIKADGVEMFALMFAEESIKDDIITGCWKAKASRAASEYAELLREGAK